MVVQRLAVALHVHVRVKMGLQVHSVRAVLLDLVIIVTVDTASNVQPQPPTMKPRILRRALKKDV